MPSTNVQLSIPFETLLDSIRKLPPKDILKLTEILEMELGQYEEDQLEKNPKIQSQISEARTGYKAGEYLTLDEYLNQRQARNK